MSGTTSVCEIINNVDKRHMTISIEWLEEELKIIILRSGMTPLTGQIAIAKLCERTTADTREESLQTITNELTGKAKDIIFFLTDSKFRWKKKVWIRGEIEVRPLEDIVAFSDLCMQTFKRYGTIQDTNKELEEKNASLSERTEKLASALMDIERVKNEVEGELYKRFLLILNSKKRKIRELEDRLRIEDKTANRSAYDAETDGTDVEEEGTEHKRKKAKSGSPVPSTSKSVSTIPQQSVDSDEEIILRYHESQPQQPPISCSKLTLIEDDTESELFSE